MGSRCCALEVSNATDPRNAHSTELQPPPSLQISEIVNTLKEADAMIAGLRSWMAPEPAAPNALLVPCSAEIRREPFGVCLIMGPVRNPIR